jgi:hypothetical protein
LGKKDILLLQDLQERGTISLRYFEIIPKENICDNSHFHALLQVCPFLVETLATISLAAI